jgi:hypothetical protein
MNKPSNKGKINTPSPHESEENEKKDDLLQFLNFLCGLVFCLIDDIPLTWKFFTSSLFVFFYVLIYSNKPKNAIRIKIRRNKWTLRIIGGVTFLFLIGNIIPSDVNGKINSINKTPNENLVNSTPTLSIVTEQTQIRTTTEISTPIIIPTETNTPVPTPTQNITGNCITDDWNAYIFPSYKHTDGNCIYFEYIAFFGIENGFGLSKNPIENTDVIGIIRELRLDGYGSNVSFDIHINSIVNSNEINPSQFFIGIINGQNKTSIEGINFKLSKRPKPIDQLSFSESSLTLGNTILINEIFDGDIIHFSFIIQEDSGVTYTIRRNDGKPIISTLPIQENWNELFFGYSIPESSSVKLEIRNLDITENKSP